MLTAIDLRQSTLRIRRGVQILLFCYVSENGPNGPIGPIEGSAPNLPCLVGRFCGPFFGVGVRNGPGKRPIDPHATVALGRLGRLGRF